MNSEEARNRAAKKAAGILGISTLVLAVGWVLANQTAAAGHAKAFGQKEAPAQPLPAVGKYTIDPVHSFVYFSAWHHVVGVVRGRFEKTTGTITVSQNLAECALDVTIDTFTVSTQNSDRDDDLRSPYFFDVTKFPTATYQGRGIRQASEDQWVMDGTLTIRGMSKTVPLTFTFKGVFPDTKPGRPARASFHGAAAAKRADFGMTRDNVMELGVPPVPGNDVEIQIDVEADANIPKK